MDELAKLKALAGVTSSASTAVDDRYSMSNRQKFIKENNIKPGTPEWFQTMFAKPELTGEDPYGSKKC